MANHPNTIEKVMRRLVWRESGCLEWTGPTRHGYGFCAFEGRNWSLHRLMYTHARGPIPEGLVIDHLCGNRLCANVEHLEAVTQKVNFGRARNGFSSRTHCPYGHAYEGENVIWHGPKKTKRRCRTCHNAQVNARYHRSRRASILLQGNR